MSQGTNGPERRRLLAVIVAPSPAEYEDLVAALDGAGCPVDDRRVAGLAQLQETLADGQPDLIIACPAVPEPQLQQLARWLDECAGGPLLLAAPDIDAAAYARALRAGGLLLPLNDRECMGLVLERESGFAASAVAPGPADKRKAAATDIAGYGGSHDLLTGLHSHLYLFDAFDAVAAEPPAPNRYNALLHIKLDHFDENRRRLGEAGSDLILSEVAGLMRGVVTDQDTAARIRGETFAILVKDAGREQILQRAAALRERVGGNPFSILGQVSQVTCSIGVCLFGGDNSHLDQVVSKAALACEVAQGEGDGQIHVYDQDTDAGLRSAMESDQEQRLRTALAEDRLVTVFQPIVNLHASPGDNYEVLLRLTDEHGRETLPGEFMSAAHHANLLPEIDRRVTLQSIGKLIEREDKRTRLFIKLDRQTLDDMTFLPWLSQQLRDNGVPGDRLIFEISEPVIAKQVEAFQWLLQGLHEVHCLCALEHAGRTAGALDLIKRLAVDYIKLDGALTHDLADSELHRARVKSLIQRAKADKKHVIVPFVEDAKTLSLLWRWDVDYIQGNYVQRPEARLNYVFEEQL